MLGFKNSKVLRSGVTAKHWHVETNLIMASVDRESSLNINFHIASKGGGTTDVLLKISEEDVRGLIKELALSSPHLADSLAEATHIAVSAMLPKSVPPNTASA